MTMRFLRWQEARVRRPRLFVASLVFALLGLLAVGAAARNDDARRDAWQRPEEVMDALGVAPGSVVADVGCGDGYFVERLSRRVGAEGVVYGVDVSQDALRKLRLRVEREHLENVRVIHGKADDPLLPAEALDAVLIVNAYHEMRESDAMLRSLRAALKPGGRLAIIDAGGDDRHDREQHRREHTISESLVREDAARAGFRFRSKERDFDPPNESTRRDRWFFLLFEKQPAEGS
jgi:predicted methyltransferase